MLLIARLWNASRCSLTAKSMSCALRAPPPSSLPVSASTPAMRPVRRRFASDAAPSSKVHKADGIATKSSQPSALSTARKVVVQGTKDVSYLGLFVGGLALAGFLLYSVASELVSSDTPTSIYTNSLKRVEEDETVKELVGEPIKAFGERTRRGRRRHVQSTEYVVGEREYIRLKYYIKGPRDSGTVHVEMRRFPGEAYEYRYLFVEVPGDGLPSRNVTIINEG